MFDKFKLDKLLFEETENDSLRILRKIDEIDENYKVVKDSYYTTGEILRRCYTLHDELISTHLWGGINDYYELYDRVQGVPFEGNPKKLSDKKAKLFKKTLTMATASYELAYNKAIMYGQFKGKFSEVFRSAAKVTIDEINRYWDSNDTSRIKYFSHYLSFLKAYGPMSFYSPQGMAATVGGYFRQEIINISDRDAEVLANIIVGLGRVFYDITSAIKPMAIEPTAMQMRSRNPIAAYSLPTLGSARNDAEFLVNSQIAEAVSNNPAASPLIFMLQTRLTSKGNDFIDYLTSKDYISEDGVIKSKLQTKVVDDYISDKSKAQKKFTYFIDVSVPIEVRERIGKPISEMQRANWVTSEDGLHFLNEFSKDGNYKYTHYVDDVNIYLPDDASEEASSSKFKVKTKIRSVFAGSGHWALIGATYLYAIQEDIMRRTGDTKLARNFRANWSKPVILRKAIENMFGAIQENPKLFSAISADDKSGFDNYVPPHLTIPFYSYILANKFGAFNDGLLKDQIKELAASTRLASLWTPWGLLAVPHAVPSGMSFTNLVDSFCSLVLGLYSNLTFMLENKESTWMLDYFREYYYSSKSSERYQGVAINSSNDWIYGYLSYLIDHQIEPVVNGDDYSGLWLTGMKMSNIADYYSRLGFIVHPTKGIASPDVTEFSAKVFYRGATVKSYNYADEDSEDLVAQNVICNGIPFPRSFYKDVFKEDEPTKSIMVEDLGIIDRLTNHQDELFDPRKFIDMHKLVSYSGLGTHRYDYIKLQDKNTEERKVTEINDPYDIVLAAGDDANYLKTNLAVIRDRTWDPSYNELTDHGDAFSARRAIQYLRAIRDNNSKAIAKLNSDIAVFGTVASSAVKLDDQRQDQAEAGLADENGANKSLIWLRQVQSKQIASQLLWIARSTHFDDSCADGYASRYPIGMIRHTDITSLESEYKRIGLSDLWNELKPTSTRNSYRKLVHLKDEVESRSTVSTEVLHTLNYLIWRHYICK